MTDHKIPVLTKEQREKYPMVARMLDAADKGAGHYMKFIWDLTETEFKDLVLQSNLLLADDPSRKKGWNYPIH